MLCLSFILRPFSATPDDIAVGQRDSKCRTTTGCHPKGSEEDAIAIAGQRNLTSGHADLAHRCKTNLIGVPWSIHRIGNNVIGAE